MLEMPLVAVDEESRTRPPMPPRQKNVCRGHDCIRRGFFTKTFSGKYRYSFRKVQIISQSTDFYFAKHKFSFRKVHISISQRTDFHFAKYRFHFVW